MNEMYQNRYVAFLDVLGFKNMVQQSEYDGQMLNRINMALNYTSNVQRESYEGIMSMTDIGKQVSVFSDSVVISYEMTKPGSAFYVLMDLIFICNDLLGMGVPVRGGVTVGSLIHESNKCFGPAMVDAYKMESEQAIYPRILVNPKVIQCGIEFKGRANTEEYERGYLEALISQDDIDNAIYLDFLSQHSEFDDPELYYNYIIYVRNFIITSINAYSNDSRIIKKYEWLRNYYNKTVRKVYRNYQALLI